MNEGKQPRSQAVLDGSTLRLYGTVGDDFDGFTDEVVADAVADHDGPLTVRLNSPGGYVYQGVAIHTHLASRDTTVIIDGLAASIASVIAMAGRRIQIAPGAMMMIHNPWNVAMGDAQELRQHADVLDKIRDSLVALYANRSGQSRNRISAMMEAETWLTAEEAVALGFADEIIEGQPANLAGLDLGILPNVPASLMRNHDMSDTTLSRREKAAQKQAQAKADEARIQKMVASAGLDTEFADRLVEQGAGLDEAQAAIKNLQDYLASGSGVEIRNRTRIDSAGPYGGHSDFPKAAAEAIVQRATGKGQADPALTSMSLVEIARNCVEHGGGSRPLRNKPSEIVKAALTTSDFPLILEDALHKSIRSGMESESSTHRDWIRISEAADFKAQKRPILSSAPDLEKIGEGGEYTYGSFDEDGTEFAVAKYGKIVKLTFEAIVNDDLDAFSRMAPAMGLAVVRKEADSVYNILTQNSADGPTMQDGTALFHADHGNLVTGATFGAATLSDARTKLRRQKDISGRGWLNLTPRFLLVPPELEHESLQLVRASTLESSSYSGTESGSGPVTVTGEGSNSTAAPPGWISNLIVIAEPRLELTNVAYVAAPPGQVDHIEMATLADSPELRQREGWDTDAIEWRIRHVFGVGVLDWRGLVRLTITG